MNQIHQDMQDQFDAALERRIEQVRAAMSAAYTNGYRETARYWAAEMKRLLKQRSRAQVERQAELKQKG